MSKKIISIMIAAIYFGGIVSVYSQETQGYKDGSVSKNQITFSGFEWRIKESSRFVGPGPNIFSASPDNVRVDEDGKLHMKIVRTRNRWTCSEIISKRPVGYGVYRFYVSSRVDAIDPNIVLGFFTWDDAAFKSMANCEIDIEWSRWGDFNADNLHFSVHPTRGPDDEFGRYIERFYGSKINLKESKTLNIIEWQESSVKCSVYAGHEERRENLLAEWMIDDNNPARRAHGTKPVLIPKPSPTTNIRINLWLANADGEGRGSAPTNESTCEVIIDRFEYSPL